MKSLLKRLKAKTPATTAPIAVPPVAPDATEKLKADIARLQRLLTAAKASEAKTMAQLKSIVKASKVVRNNVVYRISTGSNGYGQENVYYLQRKDNGMVMYRVKDASYYLTHKNRNPLSAEDYAALIQSPPPYPIGVYHCEGSTIDLDISNLCTP